MNQKMDFDDILIEWGYRVHNGQPNPKNTNHLYHLSQILYENGWPYNVVEGLMHNLLEQDSEREKLMKKVIKYKDKEGNDREITVGGALKQGEEHPAYKQAKQITQKDEKPKGDKVDEPSDFERGADQNKNVTPDYKRDSDKRIVNGKDKTLNKVNTSESETYTEDIKPSDEEFENEYAIGEPPPPFKISDEIDTSKFPKKYVKLIERMMNSKRVGTKPNITTLISSGGAGAISAQAGEVLTLMATSMSDEDFNKLQTAMLEHEKKTIESNPDLKAPGKRVINKSWIMAAGKSRKAIRDRITKKYGEGVEIVNTGWDTEQDVNAMGWSDYNGQKGFSTDIYVKVKTPDGEEIMDEVSLKKDTKINFLNSQTGKFRQWDEETQGGELDPRTHSKKERESLIKAIKDFNLDLPEPTSRKSSKAIWLAMVEKTNYNTKTGEMNLSEPPTKEELWVKAHVDQVRDYTTNATRAIVNNPKLKAGMLDDIKKEFPLKSIGEGEETMAIGDLSLDPDTMTELFGTSDFEKIKENLVVDETVDPPALAYQAETGGEIIKIASINIRQDGVGYGGSSMKFEMQMDKDFATKLKESHQKVYGEI